MATFTILEPMSTGDVIDRAVRIYRRNFSTLIRIVAIPCLIGYLSSLLFWFGYAQMLDDVAVGREPDVPALALFSMMVGSIGNTVWFFVILTTIAGLARVVGDHVMLKELITVRGFLKAVRARIGNILIMALLCIAIFIGLYMVLVAVFFVIAIIVVLSIGLTTSMGLPDWASGVLAAIVIIAAAAALIIAALYAGSRVVFFPHVMMIEGEGPGGALGRAFSLGAGGWYRVGAILLFSYFVEASLLAALTLPVLAVLYLLGIADAEFLVSPSWNVFYAAFNQIATLLTLPIMLISFTLLYFDSRVRKEAYDVEILAREVSPGFAWQPISQQAPFGYPQPQFSYSGPGMSAPREYIQTSPLGLAGYRPSRPAQSAEMKVDAAGAAAPDVQPMTCVRCGDKLLDGARFCMRCGASTAQ